MIGAAALVDDVCAEGLRMLRATTPRRRVEASAVGWYRSLGLDAPLILWAESPPQASHLLHAVRAAFAATEADSGRLAFVAAYEAVRCAAPELSAPAISTIVDHACAVRVEEPGASLRDTIADRSALLAGQLEREAHDLSLDLKRQLWDRIGRVRADVLIAAGGDDGWFTPSYPRTPAGDVRPVPQRWFSAEEIRFHTARGVHAARAWEGWADAVQHVTAWWAMRGCVLLCEHPRRLELDAQGRPHAEAGPALRWRDGQVQYAWHGTPVPRSLIENPWSPTRILRTRNVEVRRCAIERAGWDAFAADMGFPRVGEPVADPANPGHLLDLYDVPAGIVGDAFRLLTCTNASPERDGLRRRFGIAVPSSLDSPLAAAAWTFDLDDRAYGTLAAAT